MAEEQVIEEQEAPRSPKHSERLAFLFTFICIIASVFISVIVIFLRSECPDCKKRSPILVPMLVVLVTLLFFLGLSMLTAFCASRKNSLTLTPQVARSSISDNRVPCGQPFVTEASSLYLPDYFTAIQNTGAVYSSADTEFCTHVLEIRPPSYEQAVTSA